MLKYLRASGTLVTDHDRSIYSLQHSLAAKYSPSTSSTLKSQATGLTIIIKKMRFLCFHGLGTNADVFEAQTKRLREELAGNHEFDFIDGEFEVGPAKGVGEIFPGPYYSWFKEAWPTSMSTMQTSIENIHEYIAEFGPYDGAMGFSQGTAMLSALLLNHQANHPSEPPLFQVAIFFNGGMPDPVKQLLPKGGKLPIPTAHIFGGKKDFLYGESLYLASICKRELRAECEHNKGHVIPHKMGMAFRMAAVIRRSIDLVIFKV